MKDRLLTKSRFKLALECPTKLYYTEKTEYANQKIEDTFLIALADGGFQVGELAKYYFPGGYEIKTLDNEMALRQTDELLKKDNVIIYEAAIKFKSFFIRVDILIKKNNSIELIEVKAKSIDTSSGYSIITKKGTIASLWEPYIYDVAFQKHIMSRAFPEYNVTAYLMLADKSSSCPTDGLNQKFKISKDESGRKCVVVSASLMQEDINQHILAKINVDHCCEKVYKEVFELNGRKMNFDEYINLLANIYQNNIKIVSQPSARCSKCEFKATLLEKEAGLISGFDECWKENLGWNDKDLNEPNILSLWNFRKKDKFIHEGRIKFTDISKEDISPANDEKPGLSITQRQWMQILKVKDNDPSHWFDKENMRKEMSSWVYPLHFIDFETTMTAIPFNKGRHPYEGIAFQFSHHIVHKNGRIEHHGQYLNTDVGVFPNYDFLRNLKKELEIDNGSIFRYADHENTFLNIIFRQLREDTCYVPDRDELSQFILTITESPTKNTEQWKGPRNMIDMCELVKRFYYNPATNGSNSIKHVLPALLNSSQFLQNKYSAPIYGAQNGIISKNYNNWTWVKYENGKVIDPYKLLPNMFQDISRRDFVVLSESDELRDGGAALTAYAKMQFEEMTEYEREEIRQALLKYCELDTMAMVMIYEGWKDMIQS